MQVLLRQILFGLYSDTLVSLDNFQRKSVGHHSLGICYYLQGAKSQFVSVLHCYLVCREVFFAPQTLPLSKVIKWKLSTVHTFLREPDRVHSGARPCPGFGCVRVSPHLPFISSLGTLIRYCLP